jgi:hypothetical protein
MKKGFYILPTMSPVWRSAPPHSPWSGLRINGELPRLHIDDLQELRVVRCYLVRRAGPPGGIVSLLGLE